MDSVRRRGWGRFGICLSWVISRGTAKRGHYRLTMCWVWGRPQLHSQNSPCAVTQDRCSIWERGAGIQALLAARHAERVVGTDPNRRALNFAMMNARLNGIGNLQVREGRFFAPVAGERFDLVVANPPFVISPETRFAFRDAGLAGDEVSEQVVRGAATHLNEHGYAVVLVNWHHQSDDDSEERPRKWVDGSGCDAWILRFTTKDPLVYAADWLRPTEGRIPGQYAAHLDKWMRYYDEMGIRRISAGVVILRRHGARENWVRCDTVSAVKHVGDCGAQIERVFACEELLQGLEDDRLLLEQRFV